MQTTRLTSIPISYPTRLGSSFWTKSLSSSWFNDSLGVGKKVSKSRRKKPILLWFIPHIYIYIHTTTYFSTTAPSYYTYHKVMNKTWKKNHGPPELSTVSPTLIMQFVNKPLPLISCTLAIPAAVICMYLCRTKQSETKKNRRMFSFRTGLALVQ